ncbi:unnamed protein product [Spirodela intermedia]|uniref:Uncharacterized protein n=1 Tax=Spirodela intermedia TaxID=51605 RepID=A0A7I8ITU3_SPIIN|nr:unnamed protein product [Spirodela intermedia]CAA6661434.1 unnamed protein product [Spirodela intermedia]
MHMYACRYWRRHCNPFVTPHFIHRERERERERRVGRLLVTERL